ncbi:MAG: hypothetical protein PHS04_02255, partial [Tissierellia bacterium]|nr:hypothetical protein [Tissierellia bacterium]
TSSEAVILNVGCILYNKIIKSCMDIITEIEKKYDIKIFIEQDYQILTDEIIIGKMGSLEYIDSVKGKKLS